MMWVKVLSEFGPFVWLHVPTECTVDDLKARRTMPCHGSGMRMCLSIIFWYLAGVLEPLDVARVCEEYLLRDRAASCHQGGKCIACMRWFVCLASMYIWPARIKFFYPYCSMNGHARFGFFTIGI